MRSPLAVRVKYILRSLPLLLKLISKTLSGRALEVIVSVSHLSEVDGAKHRPELGGGGRQTNSSVSIYNRNRLWWMDAVVLSGSKIHLE